jgi:bifunctional oligoribonuclease and PAP phosphatase NrnA
MHDRAGGLSSSPPLIIIHGMSEKYDELIGALSRHRGVLVTTHVRPDGDALGTAAAMVMGMGQKGIKAEVLLLSHLPRKYAFVFRDNQIPFHDAEAGWPAGLELDAFDALLVVDTGTWSQLPGLKERVLAWPKSKYVLDHHLTQEDWATTKLVDTQAAAAGEIATELLERWDVRMDAKIAGALYLAIVSDTGWFHYSNTRPHTLRMAADLIEAGVDTDRLYQLLYQSESAKRFALHARANASMQLLAEGKLATMRLSKRDFAETGAGVPDTENAINAPLMIGSVEVSLLFTEPPEGGPMRVSLRSKGGVDVARFAEPFGGGGHARAAGLKLEGPLETVYERVTSAMTQAIVRKA